MKKTDFVRDAAWFPIDNAANLYAGARRRDWCRTHRTALVLDREIDKAMLQQALEDTARRFPSMCALLRDGLFWSYFERTDALPLLEEETEYPCRPIRLAGTRQPAFRVLCYKNRVAVECFHGLTDGGGSIRFLATLVGCYLELCGEEIPKTGAVADVNEPPQPGDAADSYLENHDPQTVVKKPPAVPVWLPSDTGDPSYMKLLHGLCRVEDLKAAAKKQELTISEYLCAALIYMFIACAGEPIHKPVCVSVPIDLRKRFDSSSVRNFCYMTDVSFNPQGRTEVPFAEICAAVRGALDEKTGRAHLLSCISSNVAAQESKLTRPVPYVLKRLFLRGAYKKSQQSYTTFLSNFGALPCPPELSRHVQRAELCLGATPYIHFGAAAVSVNGLMQITFNSGNPDTARQRCFFRLLAGEGIPLRVESNIFQKTEDNPSPRRCPACGVRLGEEYAACPLCGEAAVPAAPVPDGVRTALYPVPSKETKRETRSGCSLRWLLPLLIAAAIIGCTAALCGFPVLWKVCMPLLSAGAALACFAVGLREDGRLLQAAPVLLDCVVLQLCMTAVSACLRCGLAAAASAAAAGVLLFILLFVLRPKRMRAQLAAFFRL